MIARQLLAAAACASIAVFVRAGSFDRVNQEAQPMSSATARVAIEGELPALDGAKEWINSPPLTGAGLRGKVVLVDFWTYTCINWRRTLPYVRAWAEKYKDHGLVIIGVHTPEFSFEKDLSNVHRAMTGLAIRYPIAVDSDYVIWRAFSNQYWPAIYVADARGRIRYHQFGEGDYEQTERSFSSC
jgi:thiol-disulfide isomerase/thioredoxin